MYHVMILSKELSLFDPVRDELEKCPDYHITVFTDEMELLRQYVVIEVDLVVVDIDMVLERVKNLISVLRLLQKKVKIVLILSKENLKFCSTAFSSGVSTYLLKPVVPENILDIIRSRLHPTSS